MQYITIYYVYTRIYISYTGPTRIPLLGNYLEIRKLRNELGFYHLVWDQLAKRYGQVYSVKLGRIEAVVVSGYDAVRQVLSKDDFDGRPDGFFFRFRAFYKRLGELCAATGERSTEPVALLC